VNDGAAVGVVAVASAVFGALSNAHPTGSPVIDAVYLVMFAGAVAAAGGLAGRATLLWLAALAAAFSRGYLIFPALAALVMAFGSAFTRRPVRPLNAVAAAVSVQVLLRLPHVGFQGGSALVAGVAAAPCLIHAATRLPRVARRALAWGVPALVVLAVLFTVPLAVEAALSRNAASVGTTAAEDALRSVSDGDATGGTAQLRTAQSDFATVANRLGSWWTAGARLVPVVSQQRKAALTGAQVARDVTAAAGAEAGQIDFARLHYQTGGIDLAQVAALQGPLRRVDGVLTGGLHRLDRSQSPWLVHPLATRLQLVTSKVAKAQNSASLADQATAAAPSLFGGNGTRHYMLMLTDPAESRGLGGLVVSYSIVTADQGHLTLSPIQDISQLNAAIDQNGTPKLTTPADYVARYGQFPAAYTQNVTYSPDLPTVTDVMAQLWAHTGGPPLDGVLVVDPAAMASLLNFSGPVQAAGIGQLDAANAEQILEKGQYVAYPSPTQQVARRNALGDALKQALSRVTAGTLPGPRSLADTLDPDVRAGDLLFWSLHPSEQPLLERIGLAGRFPTPSGGDLLAVVTNNAATNKIDAYLQRTISDQVQYNPSNGQIAATVHVELHNGAPSQGLSTEVIGSYTGSGRPPGTAREWLSLYSPLQLSGTTLGGGGAASVGTVPELGVQTYSTFVNVPAGGSATVTFRLHGQVRDRGYGLSLYSQPMVIPDRTTVTVTARGRVKTWVPQGGGRTFGYFSF
jgi:hypothetical protein